MSQEERSDHPQSVRPDAVGSSAPAAVAPQRWTVRSLLGWIVPFLKEREIDSPRTIAEVLLAEVLKVERLRLYMEPDRELAPDELAALRGLVARAGRHEPVQFLVGRWPFLGRDFEVAPCTLIPRPCTETLVEHALQWYRERGAGPVRVLDLCTGSGCIAVSLALGMKAILRPEGVGCRPISATEAGRATEDSFPLDGGGRDADDSAEGPRAEPDTSAGTVASPRQIHVVATDVVPEAVALARRNAARHGASVDFRCGDLWSAVPGRERFDLIVSNPPYVTDGEYEALDRNVKEYEPATALRGGPDGLDIVRRVVAGAEGHLAHGGLLVVEIGWKHREAALALVAGGSWHQATVLKDGDGIDRVLVVRRSGVAV